jgi:hypothetical protein
VQRPGCRSAKLRTLLEAAERVQGPSAAASPLRIVGDRRPRWTSCRRGRDGEPVMPDPPLYFAIDKERQRIRRRRPLEDRRPLGDQADPASARVPNHGSITGPSVRWTSAAGAMTPPSLSLSARITNVTYLIETISVIVQKTS